MNETWIALVQPETGSFFGVGETLNAAQQDALAYTDTLDGLKVVSVTRALANVIQATGEAGRVREIEGGTLDVFEKAAYATFVVPAAWSPAAKAARYQRERKRLMNDGEALGYDIRTRITESDDAPVMSVTIEDEEGTDITALFDTLN